MARVTGILENLKGKIDPSLSLTKRPTGTFTYPGHIDQPRRLSPKQLALREQLSHNNALWNALKASKYVFFDGTKPAYNRFMSLNCESPIPYLEKPYCHKGSSLLLPNMVLSDGPLPPVGYRFYEVDERPALLTDLTKTTVGKGTLLLFVLEQRLHPWVGHDDGFHVDIKVETVTPDQFTLVRSTIDTPFKDVNGTLALVGERFGDPMMGFGIVRVQDGLASSQRVVTRCTYYEKYTTEEAIQAAAKSYGGFT